MKFFAITAEWPDFFSGANVFHQKWRHANEFHQKSFLTLSFLDFLGFIDTGNFWRGKNRIIIYWNRFRWVRFMTKLNKFYFHQRYSFFIVPKLNLNGSKIWKVSCDLLQDMFVLRGGSVIQNKFGSTWESFYFQDQLL